MLYPYCWNEGVYITSPFYWYHIIVTLLNIFTLFDHGSRQKCKPKPACIGHCLVKTSYSCNTSHYFVCFNASHISHMSHMSHVSHVYDLYSIIHATWHLRVLVKHVFFSLRERFSSHVSFLRLDVSISNLFHHSASSGWTLHAFVCVKKCVGFNDINNAYFDIQYIYICFHSINYYL